MLEAINLALNNIKEQGGGPFGAIVVKDGKIIGRGVNRVTTINDPTAHAEVVAIREACKNLASFQLEGCDVYTSCEPCPMCLGAIYWARPRAVYFCATRFDAKEAGFDDEFIYEEIARTMPMRKIPFERIACDGASPLELWTKAPNKTAY
jgi:guanine deaminase